MTSALQTLLDHTRQQRDEARALLAATEQRQRRVHDQGQQLTDYREQCRKAGPAHTGQAVGIDTLRSQQALSDRIEQALAQHARQSSEIDRELQQRQQTLLALDLRAASIEQLLARRQAMQRLASERREQRLADDHTQARAYFTRAHSMMPAEHAVP